MKYEYTIYVVTDSHGNKQAAVSDEHCSTIQICNLKDGDGNILYFEAEAYHLKGWCRENYLHYNEIDMDAHV